MGTHATAWGADVRGERVSAWRHRLKAGGTVTGWKPAVRVTGWKPAVRVTGWKPAAPDVQPLPYPKACRRWRFRGWCRDHPPLGCLVCLCEWRGSRSFVDPRLLRRWTTSVLNSGHTPLVPPETASSDLAVSHFDLRFSRARTRARVGRQKTRPRRLQNGPRKRNFGARYVRSSGVRRRRHRHRHRHGRRAAAWAGIR